MTLLLSWNQLPPQTQRKESNSAGHVRIRNACDKGGLTTPTRHSSQAALRLDTRLSKITWICISSRPAYPMFDDICIELITLSLSDFSIAFASTYQQYYIDADKKEKDWIRKSTTPWLSTFTNAVVFIGFQMYPNCYLNLLISC